MKWFKPTINALNWAQCLWFKDIVVSMMDLHANLKAKNILKLSSIIVYVTNTFYF